MTMRVVQRQSCPMHHAANPDLAHAALNGTTSSTRSGLGLLFDGKMPTVAGWVIIFISILLLAALLTWFFCWRRGRIGFCCGMRRREVCPATTATVTHRVLA